MLLLRLLHAPASKTAPAPARPATSAAVAPTDRARRTALRRGATPPACRPRGPAIPVTDIGDRINKARTHWPEIGNRKGPFLRLVAAGANPHPARGKRSSRSGRGNFRRGQQRLRARRTRATAPISMGARLITSGQRNWSPMAGCSHWGVPSTIWSGRDARRPACADDLDNVTAALKRLGGRRTAAEQRGAHAACSLS